MNKNNTVISKIISAGLAIAIALSVFNFGPVKAQNNRYLALDKVVAKNPDLDLFINEKSQTIDLARTQNIRVRIKAKDLYNSIDRTASFKISVYENTGAQRKFISSQQLSIFKGFKRSRVLSISAGEFTSPTKNLEFDIYDTAGNVINTYRTTISAINIEAQVSGSTGINIAEANCDGETFGECQIDYLLQRVQFEAKPQRQASTRVVKTNDGLYKVTFPFPRNKFKFLGRKVRRKTKDNFGGGNGNGSQGIADFGETLNITTINFGDNLAESQFITYGPNGDLIFNDNLFLDLEGKLGIGVQPPQAWLHVRNGDSIYPSVKIGSGPLTTIPVDGALEYDGSNLYFTVGTTRSILGAGGSSNGGTIVNNNTNVTNNNIIEVYNQGDLFFNQTELTFIDVTEIYNQGNITYNDTFITNNNTTEVFNQGNLLFNQTVMNFTDVFQTFDNGDITYDNGTVINFTNGSYMQDPVLNGFVLLSNNSYTQINGQLAIPGGSQFQVLTYINGLAMWRDTSAVFNGVVSINQTFNINNGTYFIDNGTYFETNNTYNVDNGLYNFFNTTVLVDNGYYDYTDTYISYVNGSTIYENGDITYNNGTVITFTNGSYMQDAYLNGTTTIDGTLNILGGTQFHVLTYINGSALWRAPSGDNGTYTFNNGSTIYFNQSLAFVDNIHNYFDTTINTTNNIENHSNLDVTYVDVFEQYFNGISNHFNQSLLYEDSIVNFSNTDIILSNGSSLIVPGGTNGQVLTYVNGEALWRDTSAIANGGTTNYFNGITNYFNQDVFYTNLTLEYNNVIENFYDSVANYYNQSELYYNGDTNYFNQNITFTDNIHNYFDTTINTTNNIENHSNLDVTYVDVFEQYFNGISNHFNQSLLYEDSIVNFSNTDIILSNGSSLIVPGGTNGQVLTYVNGEALWRDTSAIANGGTTNYFNGISNYFNQDVFYTNLTLEYNNVIENFYDSVANYYNQSELYYNGDTNYFNQNITFTDNIHNYFDTTINTTNNIENHSNLDVTYVDIFEQYFNGISNHFNQSVLYEDSIVNFSNTDIILSNGSRLIVPGGTNGQVLTFVNGETLWRPSSGGASEWTDIGNVLHPADLGGNESIIIGGNSVALADIHLSNNGGAMFNKQGGTEDFVMLNSTGEEFRIEGANGNVAIRTAGLIGQSTLELSDTTQAVTFSMLPSGAASGPTFIANTLGLTIDGSSSVTVNVDGASNELFVNGDTVSIGALPGNATLNVDGNFALIGTATQLVTAIAGITADKSYVRIGGNGGAITITANPQISVSGTVQDGQLLILKGTSDINTVTIVEGNGVSLESGVDFTIGAKDVLQLIYDSTDSEWIEISRSDK